MIIASLATVLLGLNKLVKIVGYIAPVLLVVTMVIGVISIINNPAGIAEADEVLKHVEVKNTFNNWAVSGFMYGAYTVTGVVPYLADIGKSTATNKKNALLGGFFGGRRFSDRGDDPELRAAGQSGRCVQSGDSVAFCGGIHPSGVWHYLFCPADRSHLHNCSADALYCM